MTTTTIFLKQGNRFKVSSQAALDSHTKLPVGTYTVGVDAQSGELFLQPIDDFIIPPKLYGKTAPQAERILRTFADRPAATGVLLTGEKGSGKTLLAKVVARTAAVDTGIPTIVVNQNLHGESFNAFLQAIQQPAVVLFDEFEKVYADHRDQEAMLTLLDGVYPSKKLFLLTCNDKHKINTHFVNRPGRVYYLLEFAGLSTDFVQDYCADKLLAKHVGMTAAIVAASAMFAAFNFDMLQAMVEEINRYGESPAEVLQILNVRPEASSEHSTFKIKLFIEGEEIPSLSPQWHGNPLTATAINVVYGDDLCDCGDYECSGGGPDLATFSAPDLVSMKDGAYTFVNEKLARLLLTRATKNVKVDMTKFLAGPGPSPPKKARTSRRRRG